MLKRGITAVTVRHFSRKLTGKETDSKNIVQSVKDTAQKTKKVREARQHFSNFLVIDFEATCNRSGPRPNPQEIIEFPAINLCGTTFNEISRFHTYVRPDVHPELTDFCTELTGIIQSMVDDSPNLKEVLDKFETWMQENNLNEHNTIPVIYGDWDIASLLRAQCEYLGFATPPVFKRWINLKYPLFYTTGSWPRSLSAELDRAELPFMGRAHSGIDDAVNIARLVKHVGERNFVFRPTAELKRAEKVSQEEK